MTAFVNLGKEIVSATWMRAIGMRGKFRELRDRTAIIKPGALPEEVCTDLVERIDRIADQDTHPGVWRDDVGSDTRILGFEHDMPDLMGHFQIPENIRAIDDYLAIRTKSWLLMANRVLPKQNNAGSGGGMHRDSPFSHQVKCIWYLSDVSAKTGPFQYVPGSHLNAIRTRARYPLGQSRIPTVAEPLTEVHADAGTLLVCDTKCIHGGKPIEEGARYAVTLYTYPSKDGTAELLKKSGIDVGEVPINIRDQS